MRTRALPAAQRGGLMIEVLVTIVICIIGLWGLTQVQARLQLSEMESYQRTQALMLLEDMVTRIELNRANAADYVTGTSSPLGVGYPGNCPAAGTDLATDDQGDWCVALRGAAEQIGSTRVGAMLGARGCVESTGTDQYMITVAWQGLAPLDAPPDSVACGKNAFDEVGSACVDDRCRRVVTSIVRIGDLGL